MQLISPIRGTYDLLGADAEHQRHIIQTAHAVSSLYGFKEIQTPIIESLDVFSRSVGETSDIVSKEMYTFSDRSNNAICLRPEGTAGVMRAVLSNKLIQQVPLKFFYAGPMFRYERPQKGRYRQFSQIGVECIGDDTPTADVECIKMADDLLKKLGIKGVTLEIHTLGDAESRARYREALLDYLTPLKGKLSEDSQSRLGKNPLRILDSKSVQDQDVLSDAPKLLDFITPDAENYFFAVKAGLDALGVVYVVNPHLVRGLDYYSHTTFEFKTDALGAQSTVLAGGRYNNLSCMLGGPELPGVGWAAGVERLAMITVPCFEKTTDVVVVPIGDASSNNAMNIAHGLRTEGYITEISHKPTLKAGLKRADKVGAKWACLLGETEIQMEHITVKCLATGDQQMIPITSLNAFLEARK